MDNIKLIVFDLYDTLIHRSDRENPFNYLKSKLKDNSLLYTMTEACLTTDDFDFLRRPELLFTKDFDKEYYEKLVEADVKEVKLFDETIEVLSALNDKKISMSCASNLSTSYIEPYCDFGLESYLDFPIFSCEIGVRKPSLTIYKRILEIFEDLSLDEILFIGDSMSSDYLIPKKLGMNAILIDREGKHKGVKDSIRSLKELL
jgi:putative hydrolase of the HAD superfamily